MPCGLALAGHVTDTVVLRLQSTLCHSVVSAAADLLGMGWRHGLLQGLVQRHAPITRPATTWAPFEEDTASIWPADSTMRCSIVQRLRWGNGVYGGVGLWRG